MKNKNNKSIIQGYKLLWKFMDKKEKFTFVMIFLLSIVSAITKLFDALLPSLIIAKFTGENFFFLKEIGLMTLSTPIYILVLCLIVIVLWLLSMINYRMIDIFARKMMCTVNEKVQEAILSDRKNLDFGMTIGEANYIAKNAVDNIYDMIEPFCWWFATYLLSVLFITIQIFMMNIYAGFVEVGIILVVVIVVFARVKIQRPVVNKIENTNAKIGNHFLMSLTNLPMITMFASKKKEMQELKKLNKSFFKDNKTRANIGFWYWVIVTSVEYMGMALLLIVYLQTTNETSVIASITALISEICSIYTMIENWGYLISNIQTSSIKFQNIKKLYAHSAGVFDENDSMANEENEFLPMQIDKISKIKVLNYTVELGDFKKVYDTTFDCGKIYVIAGGSGQGKTTLINAICGLREISNGKIIVNDKYELKSLKCYRDHISYLFQDSILFDRTFEENVAYPEDKMNDRAKELVKFFELDDLCKRDISNSIKQELSGGEKKRVDIIRTASKDRDVYLFDEPTNDLDEINVEKMLTLAKDLSNQNKIVILISHDIRTFDIADEIIKI